MLLYNTSFTAQLGFRVSTAKPYYPLGHTRNCLNWRHKFNKTSQLHDLDFLLARPGTETTNRSRVQISEIRVGHLANLLLESCIS